jgi:hypothetical protein
MMFLRTPLVLVSLLLTLIGLGNVYTGRTKTAEYEELLANKRALPPEPSPRESSHLEPRLRSSLLRTLAPEEDPFAAARAKLDFYRVVHSGGRLLTLLGLFCFATGVIHFWYRQARAAGPAVPQRN